MYVKRLLVYMGYILHRQLNTKLWLIQIVIKKIIIQCLSSWDVDNRTGYFKANMMRGMSAMSVDKWVIIIYSIVTN